MKGGRPKTRVFWHTIPNQRSVKLAIIQVLGNLANSIIMMIAALPQQRIGIGRYLVSTYCNDTLHNLRVCVR